MPDRRKVSHLAGALRQHPGRGGTGFAGPLAPPPGGGRAQRGGGGLTAAGTGQGQGRFIWQLVGVLAMKDGNSFTGLSVMPVFSGL